MPKKMSKQPIVEAQLVSEVLRPGMIVRLKSGGPKMTVELQETPDATVCCLWFVGKKLETGCFGVETLSFIGNGKQKKPAE